MSRPIVCFTAVFVVPCLLGVGTAQVPAAAGDDPVGRQIQRMRSGEAKLVRQPGPLGYLPDVLKALGVNVDSQVLAFSKTSFQAAKISPSAPRAIFFNDTVSVGSVQGSDVLEFMSLSPKEGLIFYTLETPPNPEPFGQPRFERRDAVCASCHSPLNAGMPGMMITSVFPAADGMPFAGGQFFPMIDHRSPFEDRWGGWYVTGTHGAQRHRGNAVARDPNRPGDLETEGTQNLLSLASKFDSSKFMSGSSDIVALMTLEHQITMTNLIVRLSKQARDGSIAGKRIDTLIDQLAAYMLFSDEAPIREPIRGNTTFTKTFAERGPRDAKGRSLRDFDLQSRLFRYPLSYLVYSEAFDAIPTTAREKVLKRVYDSLTGKDPRLKLTRLTAQDRQAILDILRETKPNLPSYWK